MAHIGRRIDIILCRSISQSRPWPNMDLYRYDTGRATEYGHRRAGLDRYVFPGDSSTLHGRRAGISLRPDFHDQWVLCDLERGTGYDHRQRQQLFPALELFSASRTADQAEIRHHDERRPDRGLPGE